MKILLFNHFEMLIDVACIVFEYAAVDIVRKNEMYILDFTFMKRAFTIVIISSMYIFRKIYI